MFEKVGDSFGFRFVTSPLFEDSRGDFRRLFDQDWLENSVTPHQISCSTNPQARTLRGLHYAKESVGEVKVVSVLKGSVFDVVVDMRPLSTTYLKTQTFQLSAKDHSALVLSPGIAHGFLTLEPDTLVHYTMSKAFSKESYRGLRWDDPILKIVWPYLPSFISEQDNNWPLLGSI